MSDDRSAEMATEDVWDDSSCTALDDELMADRGESDEETSLSSISGSVAASTGLSDDRSAEMAAEDVWDDSLSGIPFGDELATEGQEQDEEASNSSSASAELPDGRSATTAAEMTDFRDLRVLAQGRRYRLPGRRSSTGQRTRTCSPGELAGSGRRDGLGSGRPSRPQAKARRTGLAPSPAASIASSSGSPVSGPRRRSTTSRRRRPRWRERSCRRSRGSQTRQPVRLGSWQTQCTGCRWVVNGRVCQDLFLNVASSCPFSGL